MGSYLHQNMVKNANFRGLRRIWEFLPTFHGIMKLPPRQPRFWARLPRWQLVIVDTTAAPSLCCRSIVSWSLCSSLKYTDSYWRFPHIFHTIGNIKTRKILWTDSGRFTQLSSKHSQFGEYFGLYYSKLQEKIWLEVVIFPISLGLFTYSSFY